MSFQSAAIAHNALQTTAEDIRRLVEAVWQQTGVVGDNDLLVAQQASPNATVQVAAGEIVIAATGSGLGGNYFDQNDAALASPSFTATGGTGRANLLIARVTSGVTELEKVEASASATFASDPDPSVSGDNYEVLARINMPASTTNITNAMITDRRRRASVRGVGNWSAWIPVLSATGGSPTIGNGTVVARYTKVYKTVHAQFSLTLGSTTNFGTGNLLISLPVTAAASGAPVGSGRAFDASGAAGYALHAELASTTTVLLWGYGALILTQSGTVPFSWATGDKLSFSVTYEAAA